MNRVFKTLFICVCLIGFIGVAFAVSEEEIAKIKLAVPEKAVTMPSHQRRQPPLWAKETIAALDKLYQVEEFRLFYTTEGKHALPEKHQKDINKNNTPDYIEDIAAQLVTAKYIYLNVLELKHPFEGNRYKGRVKYFDVQLLGKAYRVNGCAGSRVVRYNRPIDPDGGFPALTINIKNTIDVTNLTPAHELFHEFQYGYTLFKNKWYLEGMARFSEYLFKSGVPPTTKFPSNVKERRRLLKQSYGAYRFWQTMFASIQDRRDFKVPEKIKQRKYITVNKRIFKGGSFNAVHAFKLFLEEYDRVDDEASRKARLNPIIWGDGIQKAKRNNRYLWPATLGVYKRLSNKLVSNSHYKNTEQPTKAFDIFLELDKYTLGDVREVLNEGRVLGAADEQVSKIISNFSGIRVWRILYDLPEGTRVRLSLKHAANGAKGGFRFTAWSDTDGNGVPDTKIGSSAEMTAEKDQWSDWEFVSTNRAVFAGVEKERKTSFYYQMGGKLEGYFGLSNRAFYSGHPSDRPIHSTQPRYVNLRVELLGK